MIAFQQVMTCLKYGCIDFSDLTSYLDVVFGYVFYGGGRLMSN